MNQCKGLIIILILLPKAIFSQSSIDSVTLEGSNHRFIAPASGLFLREQPDRNSRPLLLLPYNSQVQIIDRTPEYSEIEGRFGYWAKISYGNMVGWSFSGYLSNEVLPQPNLKHWNLKKTHYFVLSAIPSVWDCGLIFQNQSCTLDVFSSDGSQVARYIDPTSSSGWHGDAIVLSTTSADGAGGGLHQKLWYPASKSTAFYFASGFINNALEPNSSGAAYTYYICRLQKCFFIDDNSEIKAGSLFGGYHNGERMIKGRFIKRYVYRKRIELSADADEFSVILDGRLIPIN